MTAARQQRKRCFDVLALGVALALTAVACPAAATERIVVDWHTGLAIDGYDPVAFYTEGKPTLGRPELELAYGGTVWRFRNVGNREAFAARPDVYMPQFGGYDPVGIAHGIAVPGNPGFWLVSGGKLFLFYDHDRLQQFTTNADTAAAAERKWPEVQHTLSR
jgi:hypothetical protein